MSVVMVAGSFAKWYVAKLKAYPLTTNLSSAFVLMTAGDVLAQSLEVNGLEARATSRLALDRYGALSDYDGESSSQAHPSEFHGMATLTASSTSVQDALSSPAGILQAIRDEFWFWNPFRTATMAAWSVGVYTPFYIGLYKLYDKFLPKQTIASVAARVGLSFLGSIPVNAAFYVYGTTVHHTTEWLAIRDELQLELQDMGMEPHAAIRTAQTIPFDVDQLWAKAKCKLETELPNTIVTSGSCWIPINLFTFTMVPPHLRPLSLMFFSIFWNCYLSLSQHRDLPIPSLEEEKIAININTNK